MGRKRRRSPVQRATDMIRGHVPFEQIHRDTGLPMEIIERLRQDVNATRRNNREHYRQQWELSEAALRPLCPCPICDSGHGRLTMFRWGLEDGGNSGYIVQCSNPKCIATTVFPHPTKEEATEMFVTNRLTDQPVEYRPLQRPFDLEQILAELCVTRNLTGERLAGVFRISPDQTVRVLLMADLIRLKVNPDAMTDAALICPECGSTALPKRIQRSRTFLGWQYQCNDPRHAPIHSRTCEHRIEAAEAFRDRQWEVLDGRG